MTDAEERPVIDAPWWRRNRRWAIGAAALAVALAAGVLTVVLQPETPEDAVASYLDVLRDRDAEKALKYTEHLNGFPRELLTSEAMTDDWEVTRLTRRFNEDVDPATVDVTITAADGTAREGRFELVQEDDGWRILNPLVRVSMAQLPLDFGEFNGVRGRSDGMWMFPGVYRAYPSLDGILTFPTYVAVPQPGDVSSPEAVTEQAYVPLVGYGPGSAAYLEQQLKAWIDGCAAGSEPGPEGCPFNAASFSRYSDVNLGLENRFNTDKVAWEVVEYPVARLRQGPGSFTLLEVGPGEVRISGSGERSFHEDEGVQKFTGICPIRLDTTTAVLTTEGFHFSVGAPRFDCVRT